MFLKNIKKINFKGKKVLLRAGFDVSIKNGKITDDFRIKKGIPTINFFKKNGARIIILNHLGRNNESQSPVVDYLRRYFKNIKFIPSLTGGYVKKNIARMDDGDIIMLENIRNNSGEEGNDQLFAKKIAGLGDVYINDAFSVSHRKHASVVGIPKYLPSYAGFLFEEEFENLRKAFKPKHPFLLILGGVKFETKLGVLKKFIKIADKIFIGGALANNFFKIKGIDIGKSSFDKNISVRKYLNNKKIILPVDVKRKGNLILDAGSNSIKNLSELVKKSKFVLWNGPLGSFEEKEFSKGTIELAKIIAKSGAISIIGGGDTIAAIVKTGLINKFSFVSTAGGAMLEFLAKGTLPGIEAIISSKK